MNLRSGKTALDSNQNGESGNQSYPTGGESAMRKRTKDLVQEESVAHVAVGVDNESQRQRKKPARWKTWLLKGLKVLATMYLVIPILAKCFPSIGVKVVFLNNLHWPLTDFGDPREHGLNDTRNFYLNSEEDVRLGIWQLLPGNLIEQTDRSEKFYEDSLSSGNPIILYLHGNAFSRARPHRVALCKILAGMNYHVISMDYRGYGDSTGYPSEEGVVLDAKFVLKWIKSKSKGKAPVFILGHSLGSGIGTRATKELCDEGMPPDGLILESPFNNILDAALTFPLSKPLRVWPAYKWIFIDGLSGKGVRFASDEHIRGVTVPILILHARDDKVVPFELGEKLYQAAKSSTQQQRRVELVEYDASLRYNHVNIYKAPDLPDTIRRFVASTIG